VVHHGTSWEFVYVNMTVHSYIPLNPTAKIILKPSPTAGYRLHKRTIFYATYSRRNVFKIWNLFEIKFFYDHCLEKIENLRNWKEYKNDEHQCSYNQRNKSDALVSTINARFQTYNFLFAAPSKILLFSFYIIKYESTQLFNCVCRLRNLKTWQLILRRIWVLSARYVT
jgi:hypothetical protein